MIKSVTFKNFKVLRNTELPLSQLTLMVGPNGSGKSTVFQALQGVGKTGVDFDRTLSTGFSRGDAAEAEIEVNTHWDTELGEVHALTTWVFGKGPQHRMTAVNSQTATAEMQNFVMFTLSRLAVYSLDARAIAKPVKLVQHMKLSSDGSGLAGVLDRLRDDHPERFEALNEELGRWLPEFDRVLFETPSEGNRAISLRTRKGGHKINAEDISQGTLLALAILTLAYLPEPPPIVCLEEPGRGIHPRLLRDVRDAMYRLAYPKSVGEKREPVQVIATTHSPYMLDLFRDHPEEIVIAQKVAENVKFERLSDRKDLHEILQDTHLGEAWYTGVLGGVPAER